MKKQVSLFFGLIISVLMMFLMAGCGESATIEGTWANEIDSTEMLVSYLGIEEDLSEYIKIDKFVVTMNVTFNEDGTYKMKVDEKTTKESFLAARDIVSDGLRKYLEDTIKNEGYDITVEEFLEFAETDFDTLINDYINDGIINQMVNIMQNEGKYKVEENKLYMTETADSEFDDEVYQVFTLTEDTLTLTESFGNESENNSDYPKVFKRVD